MRFILWDLSDFTLVWLKFDLVLSSLGVKVTLVQVLGPISFFSVVF